MRPHRSLVVCGVQRSGTTLLCWALGDSGVLGRPAEYLIDGDPSSFPPDWRFWEEGPLAKEHGVSDRRSFINLVHRLGATPNGVFGLKLMWNNLPWITRRLNELPEYAGMSTAELFPVVFPDVRPVQLTRRDRARQAISWVKAAQDGVWLAADDQPPPEPTGTPMYDFDFIAGLEALIVEGEEGWRRLFQEIGVHAYDIVYEDLETAEGYAAAVRGIAEHLDVPRAEVMMSRPRSRRQTDEVNEEWLGRYRADQARIQTAPTFE